MLNLLVSVFFYDDDDDLDTKGCCASVHRCGFPKLLPNRAKKKRAFIIEMRIVELMHFAHFLLPLQRTFTHNYLLAVVQCSFPATMPYVIGIISESVSGGRRRQRSRLQWQRRVQLLLLRYRPDYIHQQRLWKVFYRVLSRYL